MSVKVLSCSFSEQTFNFLSDVQEGSKPSVYHILKLYSNKFVNSAISYFRRKEDLDEAIGNYVLTQQRRPVVGVQGGAEGRAAPHPLPKS